MTDTAKTAATVIAIARDLHGKGAAAFDFAIAAGRDAAVMDLDNAIYEVANRHLPLSQDTTEAREARFASLKSELAGELATYRARCADRKYVGWSMASRGPIRYA